MQRFGGVEGADTVDTVLLDGDKEPLLRRMPMQAPERCPNCGEVLHDVKQLTIRFCFMQLLETYRSDEPTLTTMLRDKIATMPEPFLLEDAEMARLKAAVKANGAQYFDCVRGKPELLLDSAEPVQPAAPASEETTD